MVFVKPIDVPDYVPITPDWSGAEQIGDGSNSWGGTPPYFALMPDDPNPGLVAGYYQDGDFSAQFRTAAQGGQEGKFRTHINASHVSRDDPIRNYGSPDSTHWHVFFGNRSANAFSTYRTLRMNPASTAAGGLLNGTAYWVPGMLVPLGGKTYAKIPNHFVVYYTSDIDDANLHQIVRIPRGFRYILGVNMDDPDDNAVKAELSAAGLTWVTDGFQGWEAYDSAMNLIPHTGGTHRIRYIRNANGTDPWNGAADVPGGMLACHFEAPEWWDGTNPWSPGGYQHLRHSARKSNGQLRGPRGWWRLPKLVVSMWFSHGGFADFGTWVESSNAMAAAAAGHAILPGGSMHTDWFGAWEDANVFLTWMRNAQGVDGFEAHEIGDSVISATRRLIVAEAAPDGRTPQVNLSQRLATTANNMVLLPTGAARGPANIQHRGN